MGGRVKVSTNEIVVDVGSDKHSKRSIYIPSNLLKGLPENYYRHALVEEQQANMKLAACRLTFARRNITNKSLIWDPDLPLLGIGTSSLYSVVRSSHLHTAGRPLMLIHPSGTMIRRSRDSYYT